MLTVIASVAEATREAADQGQDITTVLSVASVRAAETVARTTEMLPVLQEAGVVDAGGQGLAVIIEGMRRSAAGEDVTEAAFDIQVPDVAPSASARVSDEFFSAHEDDMYGYCTQFVVEAVGLDVDDLRVVMNDIAGSTVVIGDGSRAMIHGHAEDPGRLITVGIGIGVLSKVKIENMDVQHADFASDRRVEEPVTAGGVAVVAVAWGDGIEDVFRSEGATHLVTGGNTMNPSVRDLMDAIDRTCGGHRIRPAQQQEHRPRRQGRPPSSRPSPSTSWRPSPFPKALRHSSASTPDAVADENVESMEDARQEVKTGEITRAARDASIEGVEVREGQFLGLLEGKPRASGDELNPVLVELLAEVDLQPGGLVTLYWGEMLSPNDAESASQALQEVYDDLDVEVVHGGQPHYEFIVSIE